MRALIIVPVFLEVILACSPMPQPSQLAPVGSTGGGVQLNPLRGNGASRGNLQTESVIVAVVPKDGQGRQVSPLDTGSSYSRVKRSLSDTHGVVEKLKILKNATDKVDWYSDKS